MQKCIEQLVPGPFSSGADLVMDWPYMYICIFPQGVRSVKEPATPNLVTCAKLIQDKCAQSLKFISANKI